MRERVERPSILRFFTTAARSVKGHKRAPIKGANVHQEIRMMECEDSWNDRKNGRRTQEDAGGILKVRERTSRQYGRYLEKEGGRGI